jgi:hypothetical protein
MTEQDWLAGADPPAMLKHLQGQASARKLRLLLCARARQLWGVLREPGRKAVALAEEYADGQGDWQALSKARSSAERSANALYMRGPDPDVYLAAYAAAGTVLQGDMHLQAMHVFNAEADEAAFVRYPLNRDLTDEEIEARRQERIRACRQRQAALLAEVFGNPFRPAVVNPAWLAWNEGTIAKLAGMIYEERSLPAGTLDGTRLTVLADALEEAGCADEALLAHLRSSGPHFRGCFVIDWCLGRR